MLTNDFQFEKNKPNNVSQSTFTKPNTKPNTQNHFKQTPVNYFNNQKFNSQRPLPKINYQPPTAKPNQNFGNRFGNHNNRVTNNQPYKPTPMSISTRNSTLPTPGPYQPPVKQNYVAEQLYNIEENACAVTHEIETENFDTEYSEKNTPFEYTNENHFLDIEALETEHNESN
jgi:hypothetical protein